ncbi:conserved domain protein [Eggerthella sp. HGA1]|nr:conserved domain protein [Eggerthella sp. HGA1]
MVIHDRVPPLDQARLTVRFGRTSVLPRAGGNRRFEPLPPLTGWRSRRFARTLALDGSLASVGNTA